MIKKSFNHPHNKASNRNKLIGMVHIAKDKLNLDDDTYRAWLFENTGQTSAKLLTDDVLIEFTKKLKQKGFLNKAPFDANTERAANAPSIAQWNKMETLARQLGFNDVNNDSFRKWLKKAAKVDHARFLTKESISDAIIGLQRWIQFKAKKQDDAEDLNMS